jgi:hypothetical protein
MSHRPPLLSPRCLTGVGHLQSSSGQAATSSTFVGVLWSSLSHQTPSMTTRPCYPTVPHFHGAPFSGEPHPSRWPQIDSPPRLESPWLVPPPPRRQSSPESVERQRPPWFPCSHVTWAASSGLARLVDWTWLGLARWNSRPWLFPVWLVLIKFKYLQTSKIHSKFNWIDKISKSTLKFEFK